MTRNKLPERRHTWRQHVRIGGMGFYCEFGEYEDGTLGEVWIVAAKAGTFVRGTLDALARSLSIALQCGTPVEEVVKSIRHLNFPPNGQVASEGSLVKTCTSIPDWVAQEIEEFYVKKSHLVPEKVAGDYHKGAGI